ncbi:DUF4145 domain-containing protein [Nocardia seriolae]|uniref:Uncharacterized protein n=1 Tax=Nocardia seriolae TaxID=37332 RepID=A0A0B8N9W4_9NOCA|nr:DUF4145 domain-containing protein [Nocardia seriolae]APA97289.1 hypothetical protein NS506_03236 [Nocardia seriolae]MTJ62203.1 DUF4145 domain-containing protein [Nocardia seriolae]MTJ74572.1 DUF4145 domain-containing protein [Nocardia seriolae]MTJ87113.1 DUF4145 domain-containing protein [Nocardia seriolae]MTK31107.1 DUF4145 domain-containing protein [Nocardia seriolae]
MTEPTVQLDERVLEHLAILICGEDGDPNYRTAKELERFFKSAGLPNVPAYEGYRKDWTMERLNEVSDDPESLRKVLLRLADRREYIDNDEAYAAVTVELDSLLAMEDLQIIEERGRPRLVERSAETSRLASKAPAELTANISDIVTDTVFAGQLRDRLDEAYTCWHSGAPTAAIILLGSVLEGVLYDVAVNHTDTGKQPTDHLQTLIARARDEEWIGRDVADYADVLRNHRNLVHPKKQWKELYRPEDDLVRIAWNVVVAALNDLAALP